MVGNVFAKMTFTDGFTYVDSVVTFGLASCRVFVDNHFSSGLWS